MPGRRIDTKPHGTFLTNIQNVHPVLFTVFPSNQTDEDNRFFSQYFRFPRGLESLPSVLVNWTFCEDEDNEALGIVEVVRAEEEVFGNFR